MERDGQRGKRLNILCSGDPALAHFLGGAPCRIDRNSGGVSKKLARDPRSCIFLFCALMRSR